MQLKDFVLSSLKEDIRLAKEQFEQDLKNQEAYIKGVEEMTEEEISEKLSSVKWRSEKNNLFFSAISPKGGKVKIEVEKEVPSNA